MTKKLLIILPILLSVVCFSQRENHAGLHFGFGNTSSITADVVKNFKLLKSEKLQIGPGARAGIIYTANNISYYTAPAKHAKESNGIDTVIVQKPFSVMVNLNLNLSYFLTTKLSAGVNFDLLGFTFGGNKKSNFYPSAKLQEYQGKRTVLTDQNSKPMVNNFNMLGNYRKGTTINEIFAKYQIHERFSIKASYMLITSEYMTTSRIGYKSNYRYRNTSSQISIGLNFHFI